MWINPVKQYRLLEMIPGLLIWSTFIFLFVMSFIKPSWVIGFTIIFSLLWLLRVIYFVVFVFIGWRRYRSEISTNWKSLLKKEDKHKDIYHLMVLPTYAEPFEVLKTSFDSYRDADFDSKKIIIVLSGEERAKENFEKVSKQIRKEYDGVFKHLEITMHPDGMPGEMKGKGANSHWAGHAAKRVVDKLGLDYKNVIVSYFDIDTVVHDQYYNALTYKYVTQEEPWKCAYQPAVFYNNNIWDAPLVTRITAFGTTFWLMTDLARPDRLFTFSSHAISMQAAVDVGYWQRDIVTDDSRIFLQCFIHYKGDFKVVPMYVPISMDTVQADTYFKAFKNLYKQQRRWAYGSEHFPYMLWHFFKRDHSIPLKTKWKYIFNLGEGMYSWATVPLVLMFVGRLPFWVASAELQKTFFIQYSPFVIETILGVSMIGIFVSAILGLLLLPPPPKDLTKPQIVWKYSVMVLQWIFLPITLVIWGALPATAAQTRLMTGNYLGFWVTEKVRKK